MNMLDHPYFKLEISNLWMLPGHFPDKRHRL